MRFEKLNWDEHKLRENSLLKSNNTGKCFICKSVTNFIDFCYENYVCSQECMEKINKMASEESKIENC